MSTQPGVERPNESTDEQSDREARERAEKVSVGVGGLSLPARVRSILGWVRRTSTATREDETSYDGVLSYADEWHAVEYGIPLGFLTGLAFLLDPSMGKTMGTLAVGIVIQALNDKSKQANPGLSLPNRYVRQIRKELHYFLVAFLVGMAPFLPVIQGDLLSLLSIIN